MRQIKMRSGFFGNCLAENAFFFFFFLLSLWSTIRFCGMVLRTIAMETWEADWSSKTAQASVSRRLGGDTYGLTLCT